MNVRYFNIARSISFKSKYKHRMGSVIVYKNKIISKGYNSIKTNPRANNPWNMLHAELSAILNSRLEDFNDCSIYIYRETPTGKIATSYPCKHCYNMIRSLGFKEIHYTDYNGFQKEVL